MALTVDDGLVDAPCRYRVVSCCEYACKSLVVSQVQIRLETILRHVALTVLVGVQRARVDVDVGVELLDGYLVAASLQQFADGGGNNALSQRRNHAACDKNILSPTHGLSVAMQSIHKNNYIFYGLQNYCFLHELPLFYLFF